MPGNATRNHRNQRNSPYTFDDLAARLHRTAAGVAWRWRTELAILTLISAALWRLAHLITYPWAGVVVGLVLAAVSVLPWTRRRFWCLPAPPPLHTPSPQPPPPTPSRPLP